MGTPLASHTHTWPRHPPPTRTHGHAYVYQELYPDGFADYGRWLDLWVDSARASEESDPGYVRRTYVTARTICRYLFRLHDEATAASAPFPTRGLLVGPAEHDTCAKRGPFFSINFWVRACACVRARATWPCI